MPDPAGTGCQIDDGMGGFESGDFFSIDENYDEYISQSRYYLQYYEDPECGRFVILHSGKAGAYQCGDAYYTTPYFGYRSNIDNCCEHGATNVCGLLGDSVKIADSVSCILEGSADFVHSGDWENCDCSILRYQNVTTCNHDHNILITISEVD